jgi:hypothetical protein
LAYLRAPKYFNNTQSGISNIDHNIENTSIATKPETMPPSSSKFNEAPVKKDKSTHAIVILFGGIE